MKKWIILGMGILGILSLSAFSTNHNMTDITEAVQDEVTAVISKNTTEQELEDLKTFFAENGIELIIKKVAYNDQNEITTLNITLKKGNSKSQYSSSSSEPISKIELGFKNDSLYINQPGSFDIASFGNQHTFTFPKVAVDSLLKQQNFAFNFDFDEENDSLFFNGRGFDMKKFKDMMKQSFSFNQDENGNFFFNGQQIPNINARFGPKFRFIDDPNIEKLIIIDGKEADFQTLDTLAKDDKLAEVDFLKPQTAISVYGEKAKDGAIIATTKN